MKRVYFLGGVSRAEFRPELTRFFDWWEVSGPFPIKVTSGKRTDIEQLALFAIGRSVQHGRGVVTMAARAKDTAHGVDAHGLARAFDAYPYDPKTDTICVDDNDVRWSILAAGYRSCGLDAGADFRVGGKPDKPHAQAKGWRTL